MDGYVRPATLPEALQLIAAGTRRILAGGTDLYPQAGLRLTGAVLDLGGIADLQGITPSAEGGLRIGACTTWTAVARAPLPPALHGLQQAARQVGGRQVQNAGTIGGNLCNASPAADGAAPLLVAEAEVELASRLGVRRIMLADFLIGPRRTALRPDELLVAIHIPAVALQGRSVFAKLGARAYLVISIAMVAVRVEVQDDGLLAKVALAVGACAATARRLPAQEALLLGVSPDQALAAVEDAVIAADLAPIDDIRASGSYRSHAAAELVRRALRDALVQHEVLP